MTRSIFVHALAGLGAVALAVSAASAQSRGAPENRIERGRYLAAIMVCGDCHTTGALMGKPEPGKHLAGSLVGFTIPGLGVFYPPNLTPDRDTGLGNWSDAEIIKAVREGVRPDGRVLAPAMPYPHYAVLTDEDGQALAAYLKSLAPVRHQVPAIVPDGEKPSAPYFIIVVPK